MSIIDTRDNTSSPTPPDAPERRSVVRLVWWIVAATTVAVLLAITGLIIGGRTHGAAGTDTWIAYQSRDQKVFLVRPDGTGGHSPARDVPGGFQMNPDWSPDGRRLVFTVADAGTDDMWAVDVDGTGAQRLLDCEDPCVWLDDPSWSPDGASVIFSRMTEESGSGRSTLEVLRLDTNAVEIVLTAGPTDLYAGPRWSPSGDSIVVEVAHRAGPGVDDDVTGVTLSIVELRTTPPSIRPLTAPGLFAATADWSPDGSLIVFSALAQPGDDAPDLFTIRPDGSGLRQVTTFASNGGSAVHPSFTPNGRQIIFVAQQQRGDSPVMATVELDGSGLGPATSSGYNFGTHPRMRPMMTN